MFTKFYLKTQKQIIKMVSDLFENDFLKKYPYFKNKISVIIVGSVANSSYDKYSDIDLDVLFEKVDDFDKLLSCIKEYKKELRKDNIPIQIHIPKTYAAANEQLMNWEKDGMLREYSKALIVLDPKDRFKKMQKIYRWYPKEIFKEKLLWLFAEIIFEYEERYLIAIKRKDDYFGEVIKLKILKYLFTILLMVNKKYPAFDKHLMNDIKNIKNLPVGFLKMSQKILKSHNLLKNDKYLKEIIAMVESLLINSKFIKRENKQYWISLRPKHVVEMK